MAVRPADLSDAEARVGAVMLRRRRKRKRSQMVYICSLGWYRGGREGRAGPCADEITYDALFEPGLVPGKKGRRVLRAGKRVTGEWSTGQFVLSCRPAVARIAKSSAVVQVGRHWFEPRS